MKHPTFSLPNANTHEVEMDSSTSFSGHAPASNSTPSSAKVHDYNTYPDFNHDCLQADTHNTGEWCPNCQRLGMPFGGQLPLATNDQNLVVMIGPAGSVLEGVSVMQPLDVETVALIALARLRNYLEIPQLDVAPQLDAEHFEELLEAAKRILRLTEQLEHDALDGNTPPNFTEVIETALHRPTLSSDQLKVVLLREMSASAFNNDDDNDSDLTPNGAAPKSKSKISRSDPVSEELNRLCAENPDYDLFTPPAKAPTASNTHWCFVEGHDPSRAKLGKPETSKFFVHREMVSDPSKKDIRHYIDWEGFDWHDSAQIERLNKWRGQLDYRTTGKKAEPAMAWTLREKEELKKAVETEVKKGGKLDWEEVKKTLHRVFDGVVQKKGESLANPTKLEDGKIVEKKTKTGVLKTNREGFPQNRGPKALSNKSHTFYDIKVLVGKKKGEGEAAKKGMKGQAAEVAEEEDEQKEVEEEEEEEEKEEQEPPTKKRKFDGKHLGPKDSDPGSKPGPPPPPPAAGGNAGTSSGIVGKLPYALSPYINLA